jgi:hypothetical protein
VGRHDLAGDRPMLGGVSQRFATSGGRRRHRGLDPAGGHALRARGLSVSPADNFDRT